MDDLRGRIAEHGKAWQRVAAAEAALQAQELPQVSTAQALAYLAPAFQYAANVAEPQPVSGLMIQQTWFARFRERHAVQ